MRKITRGIVCILMITGLSWVFPIKISMADPPTTPNNPIPSNNSINEPINANLIWNCNDPDNDILTYDVYFGTSNPPEKTASNVSVSRYDLGELEHNTIYYWRIIAWAAMESTTGPLWNFETGTQTNNPPYPPDSPLPENHSIGVSIEIHLYWTGGDPESDPVTYDVYFGTDSSPEKVASNISFETYDPGTMPLGTLYYWRIVSWDVYAEPQTGPLWHFQTNRAPNIPSSPDPPDSTINVSRSTVLSWIGGDPDGDDEITYNVYFGTVNPPPKISDNQSVTSYDPSGYLEFTTTYYWTIISWDTFNTSTTGPLWQFTTRADTNQPPYIPSNPSPPDDFQGAEVDVNLSWTGGDPDGNLVLYTVYFGDTNPPVLVSENQSATSYDPSETLAFVKIYYWKIVAWDNSSASSSSPIWNFTTKSEYNRPPYTPGSPYPTNDSSRISVNADLRWNGGDPDPGDTVMYDVYFGKIDSLQKKVNNQTDVFYDPGTMSYLTTYFWRIVAWDSTGNSSTSPLYHFTTNSLSGGGGEPPQEPQNIKPNADASAGEPYLGYVNASVLFDGSKSHDPDGNITGWSWNFGDKQTAKDITVYHVFQKVGIYTVTLTVTDNKGASATDTTTCVIKQHNQPPSIPSIQGPLSGKKNTLYTYSVVSTDADDDPLQYMFWWGESTFQSSGFVPNGTYYFINHSWTSAGRYDLTVIVSDNLTNASSQITIYIDAVQARGAGYLLDNNGDGFYDAFYSDETHQTVSVQKNGDTYLIDKDGDGNWEYVYNVTYGLTSYVEPRKTPGFEFIFAMCAVMVVMFEWKKRHLA